METKALAKAPAFFKYAEIVSLFPFSLPFRFREAPKKDARCVCFQFFGILALGLYRAALAFKFSKMPAFFLGRTSTEEELLNKDFVIYGTLVGLFLSTLVIPFALLFGHKSGSMVSLEPLEMRGGFPLGFLKQDR